MFKFGVSWPALFLAIGLVLQTQVARAADQPKVAPPPAWVHAPPVVVGSKTKDQGLPIIILLNDTQLSFEADSWTEYHLVQAKVQTQPGLQAVGTIPYSWSPSSDTLTFHSARIVRAGQVIDILPKEGGFTILRRETNLESAVLTGQLTAVLQPEGLQVGDVLEVAVSIRHAEPLLKSIPSVFLSGWDASPVTHLRLEAQWPSDMPLTWRETPGLPPLHTTHANGVSALALDLEDVRPPIPPAFAPLRYQHGAQIEGSGAKDWQAVADVMAPLFADAAHITPGSPLAQRVDAIARSTSDPKARAAAALALVQSEVRYLAHADLSGGYVPQTAEDTWRLRYGDCKAKTALLLALLQTLGISAEPALAHTTMGDAIEGHLPNVGLFNHVLLRVKLAGRTYWLDGTREGDRSLEDIETPALGWVLPLQKSGSVLTHLTADLAKRPQVTNVVRYDVSKGPTSPVGSHFETIIRGDAGFAVHTQFAAVPAEQRNAALKAYWTQQHSAFTGVAFSEHWDEARREETLTGDGTSKLDWAGNGLELQNVEFGGKPAIERDPAAADPDAPYQTAFPLYTEVDESIVLPPHSLLTAKHLQHAEVEAVVAGVAYSRKATLKDNVANVVFTQRVLTPEISAAEAKASVQPLTDFGEVGIFIPANALPPSQQLAAALDGPPNSADDRIKRGNALLNSGRFADAILEFNAVIELEPTSQLAWADRAVARASLADQGALADADKADTLGKPGIVAAHARAIMAQGAGKLDDAQLLYRHALEIDPKDVFSLWRLYEIDLRKPDLAAAAADQKAFLVVSLGAADQAYNLIAQVAEQTHDRVLMRDGIKLIPQDSAATQLARAHLHLAEGSIDTARTEIDASLKLKPTAEAWAMRGMIDNWTNPATAKADFDAALKLDPDNLVARSTRIQVERQTNDLQNGLADTEQMLTRHPEQRGVWLSLRAWFEQKLGHDAQADSDFRAAHAISGAGAADPTTLCFAEVETNWRPDVAVGDCEKALVANPRSELLLLYRVTLLHKLARPAEARSALAGVEGRGLEPRQLNNVCYGLAERNVELDRALEICDAAVKGLPSASHLDSRAFVLLRLGRNAEALTAYDAALNMNPGKSSALYGRGIVEARLGKNAESVHDIDAALKKRPTVGATFKAMGIEAP